MVNISSSKSSNANKLIENICNSLHNDRHIQLDEDKQWESICDELFNSKRDNQNINEQSNTIHDEDTSENQLLRKRAVRGGGSYRGGTSFRGSGSFRGGASFSGASSIRGTGSSRGLRGPSVTQYRNTLTGVTMRRPTGWQWSRTRLVFLPVGTRFFYRTHSSSNRFTTPSTSSENYYYCTSYVNSSNEVQCNSIDGDTHCCEDETTREGFCCGGNIPDYILEDMSPATETVAKIFYTFSALALCVHFIIRRFY